MRTRLVPVALVLLLLAAACGDDDGDDVGAGAGDGTTTTAEVTSTTDGTDGGDGEEPVEPFEGATTPTSVPSEAGEVALLTDVRIASHPGFDRIVFEFRGDGPPGVDARYIEPPVREDGSGDEVAVEGEAFLQVRMEPASGVELKGEQPVETYTGEDRISPDVSGIVEVVEVGDFEANLTWAIGLPAEAEFRVFTLSSPTRVVVDVATG